MNENKKTIFYMGHKLETVHTDEMTNEQYEQVLKEHYAKPDFSEVRNEIANLLCLDSCQMTNIEKYYFRDLMEKTVKYFDKWSIEDCYNHKPLLDYFYSKSLGNDKVFTSDSLAKNIETAFRLGGKGVASKVANFPIKTVEEIFKRYNVNNNYYDMSCGWGARLIASLKNKVNYFGTDPNYQLVYKLKCFTKDWFEITNLHKPSVDIRSFGSECRVLEWINKMGLCFTSPPYFDLEDYKIGEQSYKTNETTYEEWIDDYLRPTLVNCHLYLIDNGYLVLNVKDYNDIPLESDTKRIAEECGFVFIENYVLENNSRINSNGELIDSNENIMVFMKKGFEQNHIKYTELEQIEFDF